MEFASRHLLITFYPIPSGPLPTSLKTGNPRTTGHDNAQLSLKSPLPRTTRHGKDRKLRRMDQRAQRMVSKWPSCPKEKTTEVFFCFALWGTKQAERALGVARAACFEPLARRIRQRWCLTTDPFLRALASLNMNIKQIQVSIDSLFDMVFGRAVSSQSSFRVQLSDYIRLRSINLHIS